MTPDVRVTPDVLDRNVLLALAGDCAWPRVQLGDLVVEGECQWRRTLVDGPLIATRTERLALLRLLGRAVGRDGLARRCRLHGVRDVGSRRRAGVGRIRGYERGSDLRPSWIGFPRGEAGRADRDRRCAADEGTRDRHEKVEPTSRS